MTKTEAGRERMCDSDKQLCHTVSDVRDSFDCIGELRALRMSLGARGRISMREQAATDSCSDWRGGISRQAHGSREVLPLDGILDVRQVSARAAKGGAAPPCNGTRARIHAFCTDFSLTRTHVRVHTLHMFFNLHHAV